MTMYVIFLSVETITVLGNVANYSPIDL